MELARRDEDGAIRGGLVDRIDAIDRHADRLRPRELADEFEEIRRIAARHGFGPAVTVVHALDGALARGAGTMLIRGWLAILRDAVGCGASDARTCDTFAAVCNVRIAG